MVGKLNISLQVLCELQMAMLERGLEVGEDVDRSIMSKEVRPTFSKRGGGAFVYLSPTKVCQSASALTISVRFIILSLFQVRNTEDSSYRNLRDWYIYRDYMNGLEYVIHAFDHLKKHHQ